MIFILVIILTYFSYGALSKKVNNALMRLVTSYLVSALIVSFLTFNVCVDGWVSSSIGAQGACSHHGGVTTKLNGLGLILFFICIVVFATRILNKKKHPKRKEIQTISTSEGKYCYRTASRIQESIIRDWASEQNLTFNFKHEIQEDHFIACFTFETHNDLDKAIEFLSTVKLDQQTKYIVRKMHCDS